MIKYKMGIMGGTFNPIHIGHLILAEEAKNHFGLDKIIFIPTGKPPHKHWDNVADSVHRYEMTLIATIDNPDFIVSSIEIDREGTTYTIDTIKHLINKYNNTEFYFITGADSIVEIFKWKDTEKLLSLCNFITAKRAIVSDNKLEKTILDIEKRLGTTIDILPIPYIDISSTNIRQRIKRGKSIKYYVQDGVREYILKNKLYID